MTLTPIDSQASSFLAWAEALAPARQLAEIVAGTDFVPAALRGNSDACCACIMYGLEIGIDPMQALNSIHVVDGRPQPSAELMRAMILRAGHEFRVHTSTGETARVSGLRQGQPEEQRTFVDWTLSMARAAGLVNKQNWQRYPRAMLLARATGDLARLLFPDVVKGLGYVDEGQPQDLDSWAQQVQPGEEPAPSNVRTITRKRAPRKALPARDVPLPEQVPDAAPEAPGAPASSPPAAAPTADAPGPQRPPVAPDPLPPEQPDLPPPSAMGERMRKALFANLSRIGVDPDDRDMRLALLSELAGRQLTSSNQLTRAEALGVFRSLNDIETGALDWDYSTETGQVTLRRYRED